MNKIWIYLISSILFIKIVLADRPFPQPNLSNSVDVISYANNVTGGWLTILYSLAMVVVFFLILQSKGNRTSDSLLVSFMLSLTLSSFLWAAGLLAGKIIFILLLLTVVSGIYSIFDSG